MKQDVHTPCLYSMCRLLPEKIFAGVLVMRNNKNFHKYDIHVRKVTLVIWLFNIFAHVQLIVVHASAVAQIKIR